MKAVDTGDFDAAWGGISSLQIGLPLVWTQARSRGFGLTHVAAWMAAAPARLAGLAGKGRSRRGMTVTSASLPRTSRSWWNRVSCVTNTRLLRRTRAANCSA